MDHGRSWNMDHGRSWNMEHGRSWNMDHGRSWNKDHGHDHGLGRYAIQDQWPISRGLDWHISIYLRVKVTEPSKLDDTTVEPSITAHALGN